MVLLLFMDKYLLDGSYRNFTMGAVAPVIHKIAITTLPYDCSSIICKTYSSSRWLLEITRRRKYEALIIH